VDRVRVLRLIEYSGSREAVERQITGSMKDGTHDRLNCGGSARAGHTYSYADDCVTIKIATLGDFPEILERAEIENDPRSLEQMMIEDGRTALAGYDGALDAERPRDEFITDMLADIKEDYR
jgi:hypothetical protein